MTVFIISHNLQIVADDLPALTAEMLAEGLINSSITLTSAKSLNHSHWLVQIESPLDADAMALELIKAWKSFRQKLGHSANHKWIALGGRKDTPGTPGSPLQLGFWGVDVVECEDPERFLEGINWTALKMGRPEDGVFEVRG